MKWLILKILVRKDGLALKLERMNALAFLWKLLSSWSVLGERKGRPCVSSSCTGGRHREGRRAERRSVGEGSPSREAGLRRPGLGQAAPPGQSVFSSRPPSAGSTPAFWGSLLSTPGPVKSTLGAEPCSGRVLVGLPLACRALGSSPSTEPCLRVSPPLAILHRLILQSHSSSLAPTSCVLKAEGDGLVMSNYRRSLRHAWADSEQNAPRQNQEEEEML